MGFEVYKITSPQEIKGKDKKYNENWRGMVKIFLMSSEEKGKEPDEKQLLKYCRSFGKSIKEKTESGLTFFMA